MISALSSCERYHRFSLVATSCYIQRRHDRPTCLRFGWKRVVPARGLTGLCVCIHLLPGRQARIAPAVWGMFAQPLLISGGSDVGVVFLSTASDGEQFYAISQQAAMAKPARLKLETVILCSIHFSVEMSKSYQVKDALKQQGTQSLQAFRSFRRPWVFDLRSTGPAVLRASRKQSPKVFASVRTTSMFDRL